MDPISAVGIAAASVQFLDFTTKVLFSAANLWNTTSTVTTRHEALRQAAARLDALIEELQKQCHAIEAEDGAENSPLETQLRQICQDCRDEAERLQVAVARLARRKDDEPMSLWRSFRAALMSELKDVDIREMAARLEKKRSELESMLLACMWTESKRTRRADVSMEEKMRRWGESTSLAKDVQKDFIPGRHISKKQDAGIRRRRGKGDDFFQSRSAREVMLALGDVIWAQNWKPPPENQQSWDAQDPLHWCHQAAEEITQSLDHEAINRRHEAIPSAHQATFEWVWKSPPGAQEAWSDFPQWLEQDSDSFYWITGKPGSGKSTLMKLVQDHPALRTHLEKWRSDRGHFPLRVLSYYAWNPGADIQNSASGLMRTLLKQALEDAPELAPLVAPRHWAFWKILGRLPPTDWGQRMWNQHGAMESLDLLLEQARSSMRMCVLVDGLDEFDVPPKELIELIDHVSRQGGLKMCVASRPWYQFKDFFGRCPGLEMHKLTLSDMETFVRSSLARCLAFSERASDTDLDGLVTEIPRRAQGVFLWVTVVMRSVILGLERGDSTSSLMEVVRRLPSELFKLFDDIWSRVPADLKTEAAEMFLLRLSSRLHYLLLWMIGERNAPNAIKAIVANGQENKAMTSGLKKTIARRVASRTQGLLEVEQNLVDYLHRTVEEWARTQKFQEEVHPGFSPDHVLLKTLCLHGFPMVDVAGVFCDEEYDLSALVFSVLYFAQKIAHNSAGEPSGEDKDFVSWLLHFQKVIIGPIRRLPARIRLPLPYRRTSWNDDGHLVGSFFEMAVLYDIEPYVTRVLSERRALPARGLCVPLGAIMPDAALFLSGPHIRRDVLWTCQHGPACARRLDMRKAVLRSCLENRVCFVDEEKKSYGPREIAILMMRGPFDSDSDMSLERIGHLVEMLEQYTGEYEVENKRLSTRFKRILGLKA